MVLIVQFIVFAYLLLFILSFYIYLDVTPSTNKNTGSLLPFNERY